MPNNYGTGPVPQNWSGQDRKFADSLKENVDVICGHRGDPLDRAVTARDLLDSGLATLPAGANFYSGSSDGLDPIPYLIPNLLIPPIVTNLTATGGFSVILLGWDMPLYLGHAFYEIWRNTSDSISSSTLLATTTQMTGLYSDYAGSAETYYYWVRAVNSNGIAGPFNSSIGTSATTQPDVALILDLLEGSITDSQLAVSLSSSITGVATNAAAAASDAAAATAAKTAALLAQAGAETAEDNAEIAETNAETAQSAASTSATAASNSATGAAGSASSASTSETNAASSENNAGSSATAASTSASNANTYATAAGTASTASQNASVTATTASNNAASSASSAGSAATSAANFASNASASQSAAGTSATSANTSATNAYTSASNASTYSNTATSAATAASGHASAASSTVNGLTARLNNTGGTGVTVEQAYSANVSDIGNLEGQYSVKIDASGHVAGFGLSNTVVDGTPSSAFIVRADKFAIVDPASTSNGLGTTSPSADSVPFTVTSATTLNGVAVPAGVYMKSAYIQNGSIVNAMIGNAAITDAKISTLSATKITTGTLDASSVAIIGVAPNLSLKSASSGERMEILAGKINVFDANGVLRVKLGNLA